MMDTTKLFLGFAASTVIMLAGCKKDNGGDVYTITVVSGENGQATTDQTTAAEGVAIMLTATPDPGYNFIAWSCDGVIFHPKATATKVAFEMPAKNVIVTSEFAAVKYAVTVTSGGNGEASADKTTAAMGETVTLTATPVSGYSLDKWTVESGGAELSSWAKPTTTFTMPAGNVSIKAAFIGGVLINGKIWAFCNVDAPGTFAAKPENAGMFYQWNRKVGWSSSGTLINSNGGTTWDDTAAKGESWTVENDPCPAGWRVPTYDELVALCDTEKVTSEWEQLNGINGRWFTDESKNSVFFPASGFRLDLLGDLKEVGSAGYYWSKTQLDIAASSLGFNNGTVDKMYSIRSLGYPVRCVAK